MGVDMRGHFVQVQHSGETGRTKGLLEPRCGSDCKPFDLHQIQVALAVMPLPEPLGASAEQDFTRQIRIRSGFAFLSGGLQALVHLFPQVLGTPQQLTVEGRARWISIRRLTGAGTVSLRRFDLTGRLQFAKAENWISHAFRMPSGRQGTSAPTG